MRVGEESPATRRRRPGRGWPRAPSRRAPGDRRGDREPEAGAAAASAPRRRARSARRRSAGTPPGSRAPRSRTCSRRAVVLRADRTTSPAPWRSALSTMFASACSSRARSAVSRRRPRLGAQRAPLERARAAKRWATPRAARGVDLGRAHRQPALVRRAITSRSSASWLSRSVSSAAERTRLLELVAGAVPAQRQLELGAQDRQRRAQLVAGVGDERALARERDLQAAEHRVERVAQARDLVARRRHGQPALGLAGQLGGAPAHPLDGPQRGGGDGVAGQRGDQQRERAADRQQRVQALERAPALLERLADDDDDLAVGGRRRAAEHPDAVGSARARPALGDHAARRGSRSSPGVSSGRRPAPGVVSSTCPLVEHLGERLAGALRRPTPPGAHERGGVAGARLEPVVDRAVEVGRAQQRERHAGAEQQHRHHAREGQRLIRSGARAHEDVMADMVARTDG